MAIVESATRYQKTPLSVGDLYCRARKLSYDYDSTVPGQPEARVAYTLIRHVQYGPRARKLRDADGPHAHTHRHHDAPVCYTVGTMT